MNVGKQTSAKGLCAVGGWTGPQQSGEKAGSKERGCQNERGRGNL